MTTPVEDQIIAEYSSSFYSRTRATTIAVFQQALETGRLEQSLDPNACNASPTFGATATNEAIAAKVSASLASKDPEPISRGLLSGFSFLTGLFSAKHAQAVKLEFGTLCSLTPQVNDLIGQTDAAYLDGTLNKSQALAQLQNGYQAYVGFTQKIWKRGNAADTLRKEFQALIEYRDKYSYNQPIASRVLGSISKTISSLPTAAKLGGVAVLLIFGFALATRKAAA